jgi:hypothetical protein
MRPRVRYFIREPCVVSSLNGISIGRLFDRGDGFAHGVQEVISRWSSEVNIHDEMETPDDAVGRSGINASDGMEMDYTSNGDGEIDKDGDTIMPEAPPLGENIVPRVNDGADLLLRGKVKTIMPVSILGTNRLLLNKNISPHHILVTQECAWNLDDIEAGREGNRCQELDLDHLLTAVVWRWVYW